MQLQFLPDLIERIFQARGRGAGFVQAFGQACNKARTGFEVSRDYRSLAGFARLC
jgi:hypothetical protein